MPDALMLFAAGLGTRMAPLTDTLPKPLIRVGGRPLIDHALSEADGAGITKVVVNLHYKPKLIQDHLRTWRSIRFSHETETLLETGGGLKAALPLLGTGPVFTMNTDAVWFGRNPLEELRAAWVPDRMEALLALVHRDDATGYRGEGDFDLTKDGRLIRGGPYVYTGAQIIATERVADVHAHVFSLNPVWDAMAQDGKLFGTIHDGGFCDVGRPDAVALAEAQMALRGHV